MIRAFWFLLLCAALPLRGQEPARADSAILVRGGDTLSVVSRGKSTVIAMTLSAILPGMGQVYNRSYWKVPIIAGLGGYFVYTFFQNHNDYTTYRDLYDQSLAAPVENDPGLLRTRESYRTYRDFYRSQRDSFGWYFLLLYLINIADAYVDASLFSFDVGDDLAARGNPDAVQLPSAIPLVHLRVNF